MQRDGDVVGGTVRAIDNDGHYTVATCGGTAMVGVRRTDLCLKWQVGAVTSETAPAAIRAELRVTTPAGDGEADYAASIARSSGVANDGVHDVATGTTAVPSAEEVRRLAVGDGEQPGVTPLCCSDETKLDDSAGSVRLTAP